MTLLLSIAGRYQRIKRSAEKIKTLIMILLLPLLSPLSGKDILLGDTKDLYKQPKDSKRFTWTISADRIEQLPLWRKGEEPPVSVSKAEEIAFAWSRRQPLAGFIPERPLRIALVQFPAPFDSRYYYKVHFATADGRDSFWTVHILMDGTIVEPQSTEAEQGGTEQLATRHKSQPEGSDKPHPESEGRSR